MESPSGNAARGALTEIRPVFLRLGPFLPLRILSECQENGLIPCHPGFLPLAMSPGRDRTGKLLHVALPLGRLP